MTFDFFLCNPCDHKVHSLEENSDFDTASWIQIHDFISRPAELAVFEGFSPSLWWTALPVCCLMSASLLSSKRSLAVRLCVRWRRDSCQHPLLRGMTTARRPLPQLWCCQGAVLCIWWQLRLARKINRATFITPIVPWSSPGCRTGNGGKLSYSWFDGLTWLCLAAA